MDDNPYQPPAPADPIVPAESPPLEPPPKKPLTPDELRFEGCVLVGLGLLFALLLSATPWGWSGAPLIAGAAVASAGALKWVESFKLERRNRPRK